MRLMGDKICITGGCGFIGANLINSLKKKNSEIEIRVLDNLSTGDKRHLDNFDDIEFIHGDIRDKEVVSEFIDDSSNIVHLAAHTRVIDSQKDPSTNFEINVEGTFNLLMESVKKDVKNFVFASTGGAILGDITPPINEEMAPKPLSPYGASKLAGEGYCSAFNGSYGLKTVSLRFSNVYGPYSGHKGSVIAKFFSKIIESKPLVVYGNGNQTRDFIYVEDLTEAIIHALDYKGKGGEAFQIASGKETSILELIEKIKQITDREIETQFEPERKGEVFRNYSSMKKAEEYLSFKPKVNLKNGLEKTWEWFKSEF